jgi:hypothetical protein
VQIGRGQSLASSRLKDAGGILDAMRIDVRVAIDRRLQDLIVTRLRRQWPLLRFVPARWMRPAVRPSALRVRRSVARGALAFAVVPSGVILVLLACAR